MSKLFQKYNVTKNDGSPVDQNAQYFVLRVDTDAVARKAVLHYSSCISRTDPEFAEELYQWVMQYENEEQRYPPLIWCDFCQTSHLPDCSCVRNP
jgi:hypothetical protein